MWFGVQKSVLDPIVRRTSEEANLQNLRRTLREQISPDFGSKLVMLSPGRIDSIGLPSTIVLAGKHSSMMMMIF